MYSHEIVMLRNRFEDNRGTAAFGLLLKEIRQGKIERNIFKGNTTALYMEGVTRSQIEQNEIEYNGWGLKVLGSCDSNVFSHNDFINNTFDVTTNTTFNNNEFKNNYWTDYDGFDLNGDGVGDRPFRLASLSSIILERVDSSFILLHSFLFLLLDRTERALPDLIPERLTDDEPVMKPNGGGFG